MKTLSKICLGFLCIITTSVWAQTVPVIDENQANATASGAPTSSEVVDLSSSAADNSMDQRDAMPMQQRVKLLEQQLSNITQMNLPAKLDALQQQVQQLNGQLEVQAHSIQVLNDQLRAAGGAKAAPDVAAAAPAKPDSNNTATASAKNKDNAKTAAVANANANANVKNTANKTNAAAAPAPDATQSATAKQILQAEDNVTKNVPTKSAAPASAANAAAEQQAYQKGLDLLAKKQNDAATAAFQSFVKSYPRGTYAPNAHYWLGQLYSLQGKGSAAQSEFTIIVTKFPSHTKAPDALLKLAILHEDAGQHAQSQQELQKLIQKYPNSAAARTASSRLTQ